MLARMLPRSALGEPWYSAFEAAGAALHLVDLEDLVAVVVDDFYGDSARLWLWKGTAHRGVQGLPSFLVDLGSKGALQPLVGLVAASEVGVAHEEAFLVVVRVD